MLIVRQVPHFSYSLSSECPSPLCKLSTEDIKTDVFGITVVESERQKWMIMKHQTKKGSEICFPPSTFLIFHVSIPQIQIHGTTKADYQFDQWGDYKKLQRWQKNTEQLLRKTFQEHTILHTCINKIFNICINKNMLYSKQKWHLGIMSF